MAERLAREKVVAPQELERALQKARARGARVVLTNGCFDLLHLGHVRYLERAKALGDLLVVGVNRDATVRALKGPTRPLVGERERAEVVAALQAVDYVVLFDEPTAETLLRRVRPNIYAKGADYRIEELPEARAAAEVGAEVRLVELEPGHSTTALVEAIRRGAGEPAS